jgi:hypothetical protein
MDKDQIIFLGICERVNYDPQSAKWAITGLGNAHFSLIFPVNLDAFFVGLNLPAEILSVKKTFQILSSSNEKIATIYLETTLEENPKIEERLTGGLNPYIPIVDTNRINFFMSLREMGAILTEPGIYTFNLNENEILTRLGSFQFLPVIVEPLSEEKKTAIKSDPNAAKAVRIELGCRHCDAKCKVYAALEKDSKQELEGWQWYQNVPESFSCDCKKTTMNLQYLKNMHALLGRYMGENGEVNSTPMYEKTALQSIRSSFFTLLKSNPREELLQKFIKENPILFHKFSAIKIIPKPAILSQFKADFAILTAQRELIFVEIEKTKTKLMKKNGHRSAELTHAFEQVRDWLHVIKEHRNAVLADLGIKIEDVNIISGLVIIGREEGYDAQDLRKLKMSHEGSISFLTFDDLLFSLDALIQRFKEI